MFNSCANNLLPSFNLNVFCHVHILILLIIIVRMSAFFSNEAVSLEKKVHCDKNVSNTNIDEVSNKYEIQKCVDWIKESCFKTVCLQFPDSLLPVSSYISLQLQEILGQRMYIMADTAYESCCIDYLTAAHINADAIIHFGPICFSKELGTIPCLKIYEKGAFNLDEFMKAFSKFVENDAGHVVVLLDTPYLDYLEKIQKALSSYENISIREVTENDLDLGTICTIFISNYLRKVEVLSQQYTDVNLYHYNPDGENVSEIVNYKQNLRVLKRRNFLMEKIRDSKTIGILIGTLSIKNYLKVIERIKKLIKHHDKKYYMVSVGRPTVAKLANFPEIEIYVLISCAMNELFESRDFYQPIVTPYDVELALNPNSKHLKFSLDFNSHFCENDLENSEEIDKIDKINSDVSLITGQIRSSSENHVIDDSNENRDIAVRDIGTIALNSYHGAGFLAARSWKGLEINPGKDEPAIVQEGQKGVAMGYQNEET